MNIFEKLYTDGSWGNNSGPGSHPNNTVEYRKVLQAEVEKAQTIWDIGCGDWQSSHLIDWGKRKYLGTDVSPTAIRFALPYSTENIMFASVSDEILDGHKADLCIIKDVLQHLSFESIRRVLNSCRRCETLLVTNDACMENVDCEDGGYRPLDLRLPPFNIEAEELLRFKSEPFEKVTLKIRQTDPESKVKNVIEN